MRCAEERTRELLKVVQLFLIISVFDKPLSIIILGTFKKKQVFIHIFSLNNYFNLYMNSVE